MANQPSKSGAPTADGITVSIWDHSRPPDADGRRWSLVGFISARGPTSGNFVYFRTYQGPPLDPINLDYRKAEPGTVFRVDDGKSGAIHGVFRDMMPGGFGISVIESQFPEFRRMSDIERIVWFGRRTQSGLLFQISGNRVTPERYVAGLQHLEEVRKRAVQHQITQMERILDKGNFYGVTSLGGARPKAAVEWNQSYWVAKFNLPNDPYTSMARVEHACLRLAAECGIDVPHSVVLTLPESGEDVLLVERYDRSAAGRWHRISFRSLTGWVTGTADFQDITKTLRAIDPDLMQGEGGDELLRRMVFQGIAAIADNHLGNFEMKLHENGLWGLSPAYDLVPFAGNPEFATRLCGFANPRAALSGDLPGAAARVFGRTELETRAIIRDTYASVVQSFSRIVREAVLSDADVQRLEKVIPLRDLASAVEALQASSEVRSRPDASIGG